MMVLGLDPSTVKLGFGFGADTDTGPRSGVVSLPGAADHVFDRTLANAADTISLLCRNIKADLCAIEAPIIIGDRSSHTMLSLVQLTGAIRAAAARAGCKIVMVASSTVRVHFIGQGRPVNPKRAVQDRCRLLGWEAADDNAADACATWCWAISKYCPAWSPNGTVLFARGAACLAE